MDDLAEDIECARGVVNALEPFEQAGTMSSDERLFLRLARAVVRLVDDHPEEQSK